MLTGVVFVLYEVLINFSEWALEDLTYGITFMVFFFKVTFFSHNYERSKGFKNFSGEVTCRRKLQKRMCKRTQNVFSSTAGNEKRVHCVWILFTKFTPFY
jgi:hypothetical protein